MDKSQTHPEALDQLIEELGINNLPDDKKGDLLIKMTEVLLKRIFVETMDKLGEEGRQEYEALMKSEPKPEELESFFKEKIADYDQVVAKIIGEFKEEMTSLNEDQSEV